MSSLSIIIVNYNSKNFLDLCLHSVERALVGIDSEVFVVDNASTDNSRLEITERYQWVNWIQNEANLGFSKANNIAIPLCTKRYILLLNPDTIVPEDCFAKSIYFMEKHHECGALGVRMVDGKGNFLPESKRGLPTPLVAFLKLSGLHNICPRSRYCSKYYMGHIGEHQTAKVEVLTGAFMFLRRIAVLRIGNLDERYFMYGEDIDYSYRVLLGGYLNYYFPEVTIVHFKGESTRQNPKYVKVFYQAMQLFAEKYFKHNKVFFYIFKPSLFFASQLALIKSYVSSWSNSIFSFKPNYFKLKRAYCLGSDVEFDRVILKSFPRLTVDKSNMATSRGSKTFANINGLTIKDYINNLSLMKGEIFIITPSQKTLILTSTSRKLCEIIPLQK